MKSSAKNSLAKRWHALERTTKMLFLSVAAACGAIALVAVFIVTKPLSSGQPIFSPLPVTDVYRHPLTGAVVDAAVTHLPQVFGIMIENSADAWPLAGLEDAFLVIEAPVEGNIPRFIAFFSEEDEVQKIGPVRSARPYYLDWNDELGAVYGHVGGSPEALDLIRDYGTLDLNEFFQGEYYYRWGRRYAPHNAYTTMDDLRAAVDELAPDAPNYGTWTFRDASLASASAKGVAIDWSSGVTYDVAWDFDRAMHAYTRQQGGTHVFTESGNDITANNVVVMEADITVVDGVGRRHIVTVGSGKAYIAQDGNVTIGTWKKDARTERLRLYDETGTEMTMVAGKTWIEVVPSLGQVTITDTDTIGKAAE